MVLLFCFMLIDINIMPVESTHEITNATRWPAAAHVLAAAIPPPHRWKRLSQGFLAGVIDAWSVCKVILEGSVPRVYLIE